MLHFAASVKCFHPYVSDTLAAKLKRHDTCFLCLCVSRHEDALVSGQPLGLQK